MRAAEIMHTHVVSIPPTTPIEVARTEMRKRRIHHIVIVKDGRISGVLSDRDLDRMGLSADIVAEIMTLHVFTVAPDTPIDQVARLMRDHRISCLPVVQGNHLVGIITTSDLLDLLAGPSPEEPDEPTDDRPMPSGDPGDART